MIDIGSFKIVDANQLLYLPLKFVELPCQVVEVFFCGIKPKDDDLDWPFEVCHC